MRSHIAWSLTAAFAFATLAGCAALEGFDNTPVTEPTSLEDKDDKGCNDDETCDVKEDCGCGDCVDDEACVPE